MANIRIEGIGLAKPTIFAALFNAAAPFGLGWLDYNSMPMTKYEGVEFYPADGKIEVFDGRRLFIDLAGDEFDPTAYDTANVSGLAQNVIASLALPTQTGDINIAKFHVYNLEKQSKNTLKQIALDRDNFYAGSLDVGLYFASKRIESAISRVMFRYRQVVEPSKKEGDILEFRNFAH